jgi:hypothetical protein
MLQLLVLLLLLLLHGGRLQAPVRVYALHLQPQPL